MSSGAQSKNLLDESSLERQAPMNTKHKANDDDDDGDWSSVDSVQKWEITPCSGDVVTVAGFEGFRGLVVRGADEDIDEDDDDSEPTDRGTVEVWFCVPTFAGDRGSLFVTGPPEDVTVIDRPFDINMLVWQDNGQDAGREGMILHTFCTITGHRLQDVVEYLVAHQKPSTKPFTASTAKIDLVTGKGRQFICANPYRSGNFVYSINPIVPIAAETSSASLAATAADPGECEKDNEDEKTKKEKLQHFYGHVISTTFYLLVQVLSPKKAGSQKLVFICDDISSNELIDVDSADNIPPQLDHAHCTLKFLVLDRSFFDQVVWISGDQDELAAAFDNVNAPVPCIVLFAFVDRVEAEDFLTGDVHVLSPSEVIPAEPYLNSCVGGMAGFLLPDHSLFAGREDADKPLGDSPPASRIDVPTFAAVYDWLLESGVVGRAVNPDWTSAQWTSYWQDRVCRLSFVLPYFIVITETQSTCDVVFRETGLVESGIRSATLAPIESDWNNDHDVFPFHVVAPSDTYEEAISGRLDGYHDDRCSLYDCWPVYKYGTEMEVGEAVRPRVEAEHFVIRGQDLPDPQLLGFVHRVDKANQLCDVTWYKQCSDPLELARRRPDGVGQVIELVKDTRLKVQWQDGTIDVLCRSQLVPCRRDVGDSDDDIFDENAEPQEEDELMHMTPEQVARHLGIDTAQPSSGQASTASWWCWALYALGPFFRVVDAVRAALERGRQVAMEEDVEEASLQEPVQPSAANQPALQAQADQHLAGLESQSELGQSPPTTDWAPTTDLQEAVQEPHHRTVGDFSSCSMFSSHLLWDRMDAAAFVPSNPQVFQRRVVREIMTLRRHCECPQAEMEGGAAFPVLLIKSSEDELRLIKIVLLGPMHTPYYQSFLAFDVACPEQFPISPPSVKFHAYGFRLNPNLYEDGYICLSLLGTWEGHAECERWSPAVSTVLQVVLSIQSLVLVKEPYYNEANFEQYRGQESARIASKSYSESVALLRIQHLLAMMQRPPADWTYEFRRYCKTIVPKIIARLGVLINDHNAGKHEQCEPGSITADGLVLPLTAGFALALERSLQVLKSTIVTKEKLWADEEASYTLPE